MTNDSGAGAVSEPGRRVWRSKMHNGFGFGMGWMWIWPLILVVFVILAACGLNRTRTGGEPSTPEEILKKRYARGEIDDEEYRCRLDELRK